MSRGHWQIYSHGACGTARSGGFGILPVHLPGEAMRLALKAARRIGGGLYGVDIRRVGNRIAVIGVNDNPSIDAGIRGQYLGEDLYRRIRREFLRRLERERLGFTGRARCSRRRGTVRRHCAMRAADAVPVP